MKLPKALESFIPSSVGIVPIWFVRWAAYNRGPVKGARFKLFWWSWPQCLLFFRVHSMGIEIPYSGDHIIWLWWWKRHGCKKNRYLSLSFMTPFESLSDVDAMWDNYMEACRKV